MQMIPKGAKNTNCITGGANSTAAEVAASFAKRKHENEILVKIHDKGYV